MSSPSRRARGRRGTGGAITVIEWRGGAGGTLRLLDQTVLPGRVSYLTARTVDDVHGAIRRLSVRGAPAIGVAAAYGLVLGARCSEATTRVAFLGDVERVRRRLETSRPTAVNLFWALERMARVAREVDLPAVGLGGRGRARAVQTLLEEARSIHREDAELCRLIGKHGQRLLKSGSTVLTHCNAGALATGGMGTALAVVYSAVERGKRLRVLADETRPLLQGARLTSWELLEAGVDVTLICDGAAASLFQAQEIDCVVVGADRIARNGDVANKIGTLGVALIARAHRVPFYVAAPTTTFDTATPTGADIPIEERAPEEVTHGLGGRLAPKGVGVFNPAFDVTPARLVSAIITEKGVIRPPYRRSIRELLS